MTAIALDTACIRRAACRAGCRSLAILIVAYGVMPAIGTSYLFEAILLPFLALVAGGARPESPDRLCRPIVARLGRLHGGRRLRGLQFQPARPRLAAARQLILAGLDRGGVRHRVRPAEPAAARLLSRGLDARGAVLRPMGADQVRLVLQRQLLGRHRRAAARRCSVLRFEGPVGRYLFALTIVAVLTALDCAPGRDPVRDVTSSPCATTRPPPRSSACRSLRTKLLAFGVSSFIIGVAGVLWAFAYLRTVEPAASISTARSRSSSSSSSAALRRSAALSSARP